MFNKTFGVLLQNGKRSLTSNARSLQKQDCTFSRSNAFTTGFSRSLSSASKLKHSGFKPSNILARRFSASSVTNQAESRGVAVAISEKEIHNFSPLLLRDLCSCPRCVNPSTRQKSFSTVEIPSSINASTVTINGSKVHLTWNNDIPNWPSNHVSELDLDLLQRLARTGTTTSPRRRERSLWTAEEFEQTARDIDYDAFMNDQRTLHQVLQRLHSHGLAFIVNVPESEKSVSTLAERIAPIKNTFYGYTWDVRSVPKAINVAYTSTFLEFHMDLLYMHQPPHLQLLHCIRASSAGGASLFTDSFRAANELHDADPAAFDTLATLPVDFHYDHPGSQYYHQARKVIELRDRSKQSQANLHEPFEGSKVKEIEAVSWSPPFQGPFIGRPYWDANGQTVGDDLQKWHSAAQKFNTLVHKEDGVYERMMAPGMCVIFDNRRVLHARRAFAEGDIGKERWLRGTYIDEDPYLAKLRILEDEFA